MIHAFTLFTLILSVSLVACSKDKPPPFAPSSKIIASQDAPERPTNLRISQLTNSSVRVEWNAVEAASDYDINYRTAEGGRWTNWPHKGSSKTYSIIHGLNPDTEYRWAVRAENKDGPSMWVFGDNFITLIDTAFDIELYFADDIPAEHRQIFRKAADRWEEVIVGDLPDVQLPDWFKFTGAFDYDGPAIFDHDGPVDDMVITVEYGDAFGYDGTGFPRWERPELRLPAVGGVVFDMDKLTAYFREMGDWHESHGQTENAQEYTQVHLRFWMYRLALHEMGHALGIGTTMKSHPRFHHNRDELKEYFAGEHAVAAFQKSLGFQYQGQAVPFLGVHWNGNIMFEALMDGQGIYLERISSITVGALADIGYEVDFEQGHICTLFDPDLDPFSPDQWIVRDFNKLAYYEQNPDIRRVDGPNYINFIEWMIQEGRVKNGYDGIYYTSKRYANAGKRIVNTKNNPPLFRCGVK